MTNPGKGKMRENAQRHTTLGPNLKTRRMRTQSTTWAEDSEATYVKEGSPLQRNKTQNEALDSNDIYGIKFIRQFRDTLIKTKFNDYIMVAELFPNVDIEKCVQSALSMYKVTPPSVIYRVIDRKFYDRSNGKFWNKPGHDNE
ncbi:15739_t:CDS:2 [Gigaspora rosea]|nr:15739_t:CDS:2 [Gigaspora rosea]